MNERTEIVTLIAIWFITLLMFFTATVWSIIWMSRNRDSWMERFPNFLMSFHGGFFYTLYLIFFFTPRLATQLRIFADWASIFVLHIAYTLIFDQIERDTKFFSRTVVGWFERLVKRPR